MKILITGASGLIGRALQDSFRQKGHEMLLAGRGEPTQPDQIKWDVDNGFAEPERLEGLDAIIHLAGENISSGLRWTEEKKRAIKDSRVNGTRSVVDAIAKLRDKPKVFISGSATGFYGSRGDEIVDEDSAPGDTFLTEIALPWEIESHRAEEFGIRTVLLRTGVVLSKEGGALAAMLTPFKLGVGGVIGSGKQWMSWIAIDDVVAAINFILEDESISGPVNIVAPEPATNEEFTKALGGELYRPTIIPLPAFAVDLIFGEMGNVLLLDSIRVAPKRLLDAGFEFKFPHVRQAIGHLLK